MFCHIEPDIHDIFNALLPSVILRKKGLKYWIAEQEKSNSRSEHSTRGSLTPAKYLNPVILQREFFTLEVYKVGKAAG